MLESYLESFKASYLPARSGSYPWLESYLESFKVGYITHWPDSVPLLESYLESFKEVGTMKSDTLFHS